MVQVSELASACVSALSDHLHLVGCLAVHRDNTGAAVSASDLLSEASSASESLSPVAGS